jgi:hypothetical protein
MKRIECKGYDTWSNTKCLIMQMGQPDEYFEETAFAGSSIAT